MSIKIDPTRLYTAAELVNLTSPTTVSVLRRAGGLAAVGDLYSGESVLAAFFRVADNRGRERAPGRKEVAQEHGSKDSVGKDRRIRGVQPSSRSGQPTTLECQMGELDDSEVHGAGV